MDIIPATCHPALLCDYIIPVMRTILSPFPEFTKPLPSTITSGPCGTRASRRNDGIRHLSDDIDDLARNEDEASNLPTVGQESLDVLHGQDLAPQIFLGNIDGDLDIATHLSIHLHG